MDSSFITSHGRNGLQELFETLKDPGPGEGVEDRATVYEKTVRTLNACSITKLSEPYDRH